MHNLRPHIVLVVSMLAFMQCREHTLESPYIPSDYAVPEGFPSILVQPDNPITPAKIELGRLLFYDPSLSSHGSVSCASCHQQRFAFSDTVAVSRGTNNEVGLRNAPPIINVVYSPVFSWDGRNQTLEDQILAAMTSPIEMASDTTTITQRLMTSNSYQQLFKSAFGTPPNTRNAVRALATFCRTLLSGNSRYDRFRRGDTLALSQAERRGMALFFSERTQCNSCHSGVFFTDFSFHSIGLHSHYYDRGRYYVTKNETDIGKFKTPTLRNIALTAPYMNEGTIPTLRQVLEHYNTGGKPFVNKDSRIRPLYLTKQDMSDLEAFLQALTDSGFITNPKFAKP